MVHCYCIGYVLEFLPNEITKLLEKSFKLNVSFTQHTISSGKICFQVNAVVEEIKDTNSLLQVTPTTSQSSSLMISQSADSSIQRTPQKSVAFPSPSKSTTTQTTHASSATPTKTLLSISEPQLTPQSHKEQHDSQDKILTSTADAPGDSSTKTLKSNTKKRTRPSPDKKIAKKLFTGKEARDEDDQSDDGAAAIDDTRRSPTKDA
ncbi:unnamed protein product [Urochloa humidicola]